MHIGQFIAEEVVRGFNLFKPSQIRFFGFDDWLVTQTTRAFQNYGTGVKVVYDEKYNGRFEYVEGLFLCSDTEIYQVDVGRLAKLHRKKYAETYLLTKL